MKKILALVLVLVLCVAALASCNPQDTIAGLKDKITGIFEKENVALEEAASFVFDFYKNEPTSTPATYSRTTSVFVKGVKYSVAWSVDTDLISIVPSETDENAVMIVIPELTDVEIPYVLTATISDAEGETTTKTFNHVIPTFKVNTWEEYMAATDGDSVIIQGYAVAVQGISAGNKYNTFYVHDLNGAGGYYVYTTEKVDGTNTLDPVTYGIQDGMIVRVTGTKAIYNGTHEIKDANIKIVNSEIANVPAYDLTEEFGNASGANDANLIAKLGMVVTIKGVEITGQDTASKYMYFMYNGVTSYLRVSNSDCPVAVPSASRNQIFTDHANHQGYLADVTGVVVLYNGSIYLNPVSATPFVFHDPVERTPEEKVSFTKTGLTLTDHIKTNQEITVPTISNLYKDVTISWASNNACIVADGGTLTVTLPKGGEATVTITATITCGSVSDTKEFTVRVDKAPNLVPQVATTPEVGVAYKYYLLQETTQQNLYFIGTTANTYYLATSEKATDAVDVYLEAVDGVENGYRMYFMDGSVKSYVVVTERDDKPGNANVGIVPGRTPSEYFTWDAAKGILIATNAATGNSFYIGTYSSFATFSASNVSYYGGKGNFAAKLVTLVDVGNVPAADKVAAEKETLTLPELFEYDTVYTLPTPVVYEGDVTITWVSNNACAVISADGKTLTITTQRYEQQVTVTATIKCEGVTETKEFNFDVSDKVYLELSPVETPVAGVPYKLYVNHATINKTLYFNGSLSGSYYLATATNSGAGVYVYVEAVEGVDGGYRLYFMDGETKTYIVILQRDGENIHKANAGLTTTVPATYYTWNAEVGTFVMEGTEGHSFYLGAYGTFETLSASNITYITGDGASALGTSNFVIKFATMTCSHYYPQACATACEFCGATRTEAADHTYDNSCDKVCNVCSETRTTTHTDEDGNEVCEVCGVDFALKTPEDIVNALYALESGETLRGGKLYTLTGVITKIDSEYSAQYGNITVTIVVNGMTDKPIQCYRLKGDAASIIELGDTITVNGKLKRHYSTYEFDSGCTLTSFVAADAADADKLAYEKELVTFETEFVADATIALKTNGLRYSDVTIAWASNSPYVVVSADGKTATVTLQRYAQTATVTATVTAGELSETLTFDVTLAEKVYLVNTPVATPVAGVAYKAYLTQAKLGKTLYFAGAKDGNFLATTESAGLGVDVYLEEVDGGFNMYFMNGDVKTYIAVFQNSSNATKGYVDLITETPANVYTWNAEAGTLFVTFADGNIVYLGTYGTFTTVSVSNTSYITGDSASAIGVSQFVLQFATVSCSHYYPAACAEACEFCGVKRETTDAAHTYETACSEECTVCKEKRTEGLVHTYQYNCSTVCSVCNKTTRTEGLVHTYEFECTAKCTYCDYERTPKEHIDTNPYDAKCDYCGCDVSPFKAGTPLVMYGTIGETPVYFTGKTAGNTLAADLDAYDATYVYVDEIARDNAVYYQLYILDGETKSYIEINGENVVLATNPSMSYTFNSKIMAFVSVIDGRYICATTVNSELVFKAYQVGSDPAPVRLSEEEIAMTPDEILDALYALEAGAALDGTYTLTGVIISIDTEYSAQYKNVTVTIVVNGNEAQAVQCYRLKGTGADQLAVGDYVTVNGTLKNYKGTREFDGAKIVSYVKANALDEATLALEDGFSLNGNYVVKGTVTLDEENNAYVTIGNTAVSLANLSVAGDIVLANGATIEIIGELANKNGEVTLVACRLISYTTDNGVGETPAIPV